MTLSRPVVAAWTLALLAVFVIGCVIAFISVKKACDKCAPKETFVPPSSLPIVQQLPSFSKPHARESHSSDAYESDFGGGDEADILVREKRGKLVRDLALYVSSFSERSYRDEEDREGEVVADDSAHKRDAKNWRDVAPGADGSRDLAFDKDPSFSVKEGMTLFDNFARGPLSVDAGLDGDRPFSCIFLLSFATDLIDDVSLFRLFSNNTSDNNCMSVFLERGQRGMNTLGVVGGKNVVSFTGRVNVGSRSLAFDAEPSVTPGNPCLLVVTKDYERISARLVDVATPMTPMTLMDESIASLPTMTLSNRAMDLNASKNFPGNVLAFGLVGRPMGDSDVTDWAEHYRDVFHRLDEAYQRMQALLEANAVAKSCTFDERTCAACGGVGDWTSMSSIIAGGADCHKAFAAHCQKNPGAKRCECWNAADPVYGSGTCTAIRNVFGGGAPVCTTSDVTTLIEEREEVDAKERMLKDLVRPENIVAVGRVLDLLKGDSKGGKCCNGKKDCKNPKCHYKKKSSSGHHHHHHHDDGKLHPQSIDMNFDLHLQTRGGHGHDDGGDVLKRRPTDAPPPVSSANPLGPTTAPTQQIGATTASAAQIVSSLI